MREALQSLLQQGLVTGLPQKAKFIRHLTAREIEDSYCLGGTLEGACIVQSLERWDDKALGGVEEILAEMGRQSRAAAGLAALSQIDEAFHDALLAPCRNRLMAGIARNSCAHISKFLYYKCWDTLFSPREFYQRREVISRRRARARSPAYPADPAGALCGIGPPPGPGLRPPRGLSLPVVQLLTASNRSRR